MAQSKTRASSERAIRALLDRHACPVPYHVVRTRFLGSIACLDPDLKPMTVVASLWGGELPEFDSIDDVNELLGALIMGLWNELASHQNPRAPFRATWLPLEPTSANLGNFGMIRAQEVEGFVEALFNGENETSLPERAHKAVTNLGEIRAIMLGVADLIGRTKDEPEDREQIRQTIKNLRDLTGIMEIEIHAAVISCVSARGQGGAGFTKPQATHH
jgi:hypothetical protein